MGLDPSGIIKEVARAVAGPVFKASKEWIDSVVDYDKNLTDVGDHRHQLENQRKEIEQRVQLGIMNNEVPVDEVNEWLTAVDALMASKDGDWEELLQDESTRKKAERSCIGLFWSPLYRHDLSTKAVEKSKEINDKMEIIRKRGQAPLTLETKHGFGESKSTFFCQGLQSREDTLKQILDALKDDKVNRVGVYGMGGAGKTTLMEELARRVDNMKLFSDIILVEISQFPNIRGIQDQLAGNIHFNLDQYHDTEVRAFNLGIRLKNIVNDNKIDEDSGKQGKDEKLLVILDNMWDKLDLQLIGIPYDLENDLRCKIIVTTRSDYVCKTMGIATPAVFNVGDLSDAEAKLLFRYKLGDILDIDGYKKVSEELLEKCSRLPLTITILGDTLRNQDLTVWKHILRQLENPIQGEIAGLLRSTYSIIELSYNNVGIIEKRVFFLLCCLSPQGSNVSIHTVFKYGIGMGLFQYVSSLTEAIDQVYKWVDDLKTLSLFKDFDAEKGDIVIHDDVRHAGKTFALREKHTFLIGSIPKWLEKDSYENLTAISMVFDNSYEYLGNQNMPKLQLLCAPLDTCSSKLDEKYFLGLSKLRVLDISKSKIRSLPSSLRMLQNLKTLLMEDCFFEDDIDITHIGQLGNIQVLSFRNSNITRLPVEIRSLGDLKMLDLTDCNMLIKIPADALTTITQLEGLYMQNSFCGWEIEGDMASLSELSSMCLNVLEIGVQSKEQLIDGDFPCLDLSSYVIGYSISSRLQKKYLSTFPRELQISGLHVGDLIKEGWRRMVTKAESLYLSNIDSLKNVAPYLSEYGLNEVRRMEITMCEEIECVVSGKVLYQSVGFPKLKTLWLESLPNLRSICHGRHPANLFFDLQDLRLSELNGLKNHALPIHHAAKLKILKVQDCENLKYVFSTSPSTLSMQSEGSCEFVFTCLKKLKLRKLPKFEGLCSGNDKGKHLFSRKMKFPCLGSLKLNCLTEITELWDIASSEEFVKNFPVLAIIDVVELSSLKHIWSSDLICMGSSFNRAFIGLKELKIRDCVSMVTLCPPIIAAGLRELELLTIRSSQGMKQIISTEHESHVDDNFLRDIVVGFPKLLTLELIRLSSLTCFYKGRAKIEFPTLKTLNLENLYELETFSSKYDNLLFDRELENLKVRNVPITTLWDVKTAKSFLEMFPNLQSLFLLGLDSLTYIWRKELCMESHDFPNLKEIDIYDCRSLKSIYESSAPSDNKSSMAVNVRFAGLQTLELTRLDNFEYFLQGEVQLELVALKQLSMTDLPNMKTFVAPECDNALLVPLFSDKISFPVLKVLVLESVIRVEELWAVSTSQEFTLAFPSLQKIIILDLPKIRHIWNNDLSENSTYFGRLVNIMIARCENLEFLCSFKGNSSISSQKLQLISFPVLEVLHLEKLNNFISLFQGSSLYMEFQTLKKLTLKDLSKIKSIFIRPSAGMFEYGSWETEEIEISGDNDVDIEEIERTNEEYDPVGKQNAVIFNGNVEFPSLEELYIEYMPLLEQIFDIGDDQNDTMDNTVSFPKLKTLGMQDLPMLKQLPRQILPTLSYLRINELQKLRCLVSLSSSNVSMYFKRLEELEVRHCDDLEVIIASTEVLEEEDSEFVFPKLKKITISDAPSLHTFSTVNNPTKFPALKEVKLEGNPMIHSFTSSTSLEAPNLRYVEVDGRTNWIERDRVLNAILQQQFDSNHKGLAKTLQHKLHEEHELKLYVNRPYICDGCNKREAAEVYSYACTAGNATLTCILRVR